MTDPEMKTVLVLAGYSVYDVSTGFELRVPEPVTSKYDALAYTGFKTEAAAWAFGVKLYHKLATAEQYSSWFAPNAR